MPFGSCNRKCRPTCVKHRLRFSIRQGPPSTTHCPSPRTQVEVRDTRHYDGAPWALRPMRQKSPCEVSEASCALQYRTWKNSPPGATHCPSPQACQRQPRRPQTQVETHRYVTHVGDSSNPPKRRARDDAFQRSSACGRSTALARDLTITNSPASAQPGGWTRGYLRDARPPCCIRRSSSSQCS